MALLSRLIVSSSAAGRRRGILRSAPKTIGPDLGDHVPELQCRDRKSSPSFAVVAWGRNRQDNVTENVINKDCGPPMWTPERHIRVTGSALKNWAVAQLQDSIAVSLCGLLGRDPQSAMAPLWAGLLRPANRDALRTSTQLVGPVAGGFFAPLARLGTPL